MTRKNDQLDAKRAQVARQIRDMAPSIETLVGLLDEVKVDLLLIALCGAKLPAAS